LSLPPEGLLEAVVLEEIQGPFFGFFVAAYVVATRRGFYAYGKLCHLKPSSVWETPDARAKMSLGPRRDATSALEGLLLAVEARLSRQPFNRTTLGADLT
jgi:hypothetical protein